MNEAPHAVEKFEVERCRLLREGGKHSVYFNPADRRTSSVPRHTEIADKLAHEKDARAQRLETTESIRIRED